MPIPRQSLVVDNFAKHVIGQFALSPAAPGYDTYESSAGDRQIPLLAFTQSE
jgi:hypothetical protein